MRTLGKMTLLSGVAQCAILPMRAQSPALQRARALFFTPLRQTQHGMRHYASGFPRGEAAGQRRNGNEEDPKSGKIQFSKLFGFAIAGTVVAVATKIYNDFSVAIPGSKTTSKEVRSKLLVTQVELAVDVQSDGLAKALAARLETLYGISAFNLDRENGILLVEATIPAAIIVNVLRSIGVTAVVRGISGATTSLGAAVCELSVGRDGTRGVVRLVQATEDDVIIEGVVDGLEPGKHGIRVCECGDLSNGCRNTGPHYNPGGHPHGAPGYPAALRHAGDLGNVTADSSGRAVFRIEDSGFKLADVIGRSIVISESPDRYHPDADNTEGGVACGIIARASSVSGNTKRICACDGKTLWEEAQAQPPQK
eukprot:Opistho-2@2328